MDKDYIKNIVQNVLNKEFSSIQRRKIVEYSDRLNICCPYCGDGKSEYKKRGNLYFNRLFYVCFNCDTKTTFDKICKRFNEQIDPEKKLEIIEYLDSIVTYSDYENNFVDAKFDNLINFSDLETIFKSDITPISDFTPIINNGGIYKYLVNRGIPSQLHQNIYQAKYWKNEDTYEWVIVLLNRRKDKVLGIQIRNLKSGKKRMFKIFNFENLLEWSNLVNTVVDIDMSELIIYNKLSYYFNILNVDFDKTITVFEGYLDSLFYPNSIGMVGVNTDSRFLENNEFELQYFFDNDDAGYKKSEEKIKKGVRVFLWQKLFENIVSKKNDNDPYKYYYRINKVKDINKLAEFVKDPFSKLELYNFFSSDVLDLKWIPKLKKIKKEDFNYNLKFNNFKFV